MRAVLSPQLLSNGYSVSRIVLFIGYYWDDQIEEDEMGEHVVQMGEIRTA
jgi:hypothetical protein